MNAQDVDLSIDSWFEYLAGQFAGNVIQIWFYKNAAGRRPYCDWFRSLDCTVRIRVSQRLDRVSLGNFGDISPFSDRVWEMRLDFGPGYRIYYCNLAEKTIGLLYAGDKSSQQRDGNKSISAWKNCRRKV